MLVPEQSNYTFSRTHIDSFKNLHFYSEGSDRVMTTSLISSYVTIILYTRNIAP